MVEVYYAKGESERSQRGTEIKDGVVRNNNKKKYSAFDVKNWAWRVLFLGTNKHREDKDKLYEQEVILVHYI